MEMDRVTGGDDHETDVVVCVGGRGEVGVSNRKTEVELKTAWP